MSELAFSFLAAVGSGLVSNSSFGMLTKVDPGCSHLVTLLQQAFSILLTYGAFGDVWGNRGLRIPLGYHFIAAVFTIFACWLGNISLGYLPLPLFFLIKCGNLVATLLVGYMLLGKRYASRQVASVLIVTLGLLISTATANKNGRGQRGGDHGGNILVGSGLLALALVCNSVLGIVQELAFKTHGKYFNEMTLVSTLFFLPLYAALNRDSITVHASAWFSFGGGEVWGKVWPSLLANMVASHVCRLSMCRLTASSLGSLCAMFATTAFRFASIIAAAVLETYARAAQPADGESASEASSLGDIWVGIFFVLAGSLLALSSPKPTSTTPKEKAPKEAGQERSLDKNHVETIIETAEESSGSSDDDVPFPPKVPPPPQSPRKLVSRYMRERSRSFGDKLSQECTPIAPSAMRNEKGGDARHQRGNGKKRAIARGLERVISDDLLKSWGGESPSAAQLRSSLLSKSIPNKLSKTIPKSWSAWDVALKKKVT